MPTATKSDTRMSSRSVAAAASISLWLLGSTLNPVTAISEGSSLDWRAEPATAGRGEIITSVVGDPTGPKVKVVMYNGSGDQERIAGIPIELKIVEGPANCPRGVIGRVETNDNGVAVFAPRIVCKGPAYRLQAFAADTASVNSGHIAETPRSRAFDIHDSVSVCTTTTCTGNASGAGTSVEVTASSTGYLVLDLDDEQLTCEGYTTSSGIAEFEVVGGEGRTTVTITLDADIVTRPAKKYEVCLKKDGSPATQLADCPKTVNGAPSCVVSRKREKDGDVRVIISVEPGDPRVGL